MLYLFGYHLCLCRNLYYTRLITCLTQCRFLYELNNLQVRATQSERRLISENKNRSLENTTFTCKTWEDNDRLTAPCRIGLNKTIRAETAATVENSLFLFNYMVLSKMKYLL
jgi:hypothetical protein